MPKCFKIQKILYKWSIFIIDITEKNQKYCEPRTRHLCIRERYSLVSNISKVLSPKKWNSKNTELQVLVDTYIKLHAIMTKKYRWSIIFYILSLKSINHYLYIKFLLLHLGTLRVWSADRACRAPEVIDCGDNCCAENSHNIVCQYQCSGVGNTVCNNRNISKPPKNTNGATETLPTIITILASVVLIVLNSCFVWLMPR